MKVADSFKGRPIYEKSRECCLMITKQLVIFIASTNVPNSIIENADFRDFVKILDSRYPVPGRTLIAVQTSVQ